MAELYFKGKNIGKLNARTIMHEGNKCIEVRVLRKKAKPEKVIMSFKDLNWSEMYQRAIEQNLIEELQNIKREELKMKKLIVEGVYYGEIQARMIRRKGKACIEMKYWKYLEREPLRKIMTFEDFLWEKMYIRAIRQDLIEKIQKKN